MIKGGGAPLECYVCSISRDRSGKTGLVDIGDRYKNWLFSKTMFSVSGIESSNKSVY